jgi:hypothetical protein
MGRRRRPRLSRIELEPPEPILAPPDWWPADVRWEGDLWPHDDLSSRALMRFEFVNDSRLN